MNRFLPLAASIISLIILIFLWDKIKLPYDQNNFIYGNYLYNSFNPNNNILRFFVIILIPSFIYLLFYIKENQNLFSLKLNNQEYFLNNNSLENEKKISSNYLFFFLFILILEFCFIDFKIFLQIDKFHDTVYLTPPINYLNTKNFFSSTLYDYGFIGNNLGLIFYYFFGFYSLGSIKLIQLILIFLIKILLVFFSKLLIENINLDEYFKKLFFLIYTFILINMPNYYDFQSYYSPRSFLFLIFIFLTCFAITREKKNNIILLACGIFSPLSLLWWFDIGFYVNFLLIILSIYLLIHSKIKSFLLLLYGAILSWLIIFAFFPLEEIQSFLYNIKFIIKTTNYLIGLEYLKPFSLNSGRWTKAILIIYATTIILINFNLSKRLNISKNLKLILNFIFLSGIVLFNSALTRSDSYHLKYTSGIYSAVFIFLILYLFFHYLSKNKFIIKKKSRVIKKLIFICTSILFVIILFFNFNFNFSINSLKNIFNINNNIKSLLTSNEEVYFEKNDLLVLEKYRNLSVNDNCLQYFTDDNYFPFYLNKPTCTKFYLANQLIDNFSGQKFISEFKKNSPQIILLKSPTKILIDQNNFIDILEYIEKNYFFLEDFNGYIFYKKR